MNYRNLLLVVLLIGVFLVACAPAETMPESQTQPLEPEAAPEESVSLPTPARVQPTLTQSPTPTATPPELTVEIVPESPTKTVPTQEIVPMPDGPAAATPSDPYSLELIDRAKTDLAQRLGVPKEEVVLTSFSFVTWSDASLGCPKPGMEYAQVLVDGYLIMLRVGLGIYNYHGGGDPSSGPFLCEGGIGTKIIVPPPNGSLDK